MKRSYSDLARGPTRFLKFINIEIVSVVKYVGGRQAADSRRSPQNIGEVLVGCDSGEV